MDINKIVIVGGGSSGWITAATIIKFYPEIDLTLIESESISTIGVGESTQASITSWMNMLDIDKEEMLRETDGSYKLGIKFNNFYSKNDSGFFYPFGKGSFDKYYGELDPVSLWNLKKLIKPDGSESDDYLTPAAAADFNKMVLAAKEDGVEISSSQGYRPLGSEEEGCSKSFTQWCAWKKYKSGTGALAAKPGTSNHGLGLAVDINRCKRGGKVHNWLIKNAEKFNFFPFSKESWHWTYGFKEGQKPQSMEVEKEPEKIDSFIPEPIPDKETSEPSKPESTQVTQSPDEKLDDKSQTNADDNKSFGEKFVEKLYGSVFSENVKSEQLNEEIGRIKELFKYNNKKIL